MSDLGSHEVSRRGLLRLGLTLGLSAAVCPLAALGLPESAFAAVAQHPLRLYNPHTRERYDIQLFSGKQFDRLGLIKCDWMMRDWRESQTVKCDRKLYAALYVIQHKFGVRDPISINSGFRSVKTNMALRRRSIKENGQESWETPAVHSKHCEAQAVDFAVPGVKPREIAAFVESLKIGGTGNYATFTHMDTASIRRWGPAP
jgi:uncharacterized protein YcbK (DUF882 family)